MSHNNQLAAARPGSTKKGGFLRTLKKYKYFYIMLIPPILYYLIFCYLPMYGVVIAFENYSVVKGIFASKWVGVKYFAEYLGDVYFWKLVRNTLLLNIYNLIFGFPAPIILALLMNELRGRAFKRVTQTVSYLPHFISTVVVCGMIISFLSNDGPINNLLARLGLSRISFLMESGYFRTIFVSTNIWQSVGWGSIIYLAAITNVDTQLYEAATIDGAGRFTQIIHVTLPAIMPVVITMLILNIGSLMNVAYEKILLLYTGPTYDVADVIQTYVYRRGIQSADFSYATAVGLFQSVIGMIFLYGANMISRKVTDESLW